MPVLGLGAYRVGPGPVARTAVLDALGMGYRHIDTASMYGNEKDVGAAVRESGIARDEVWVTTKLWNTDHGYEAALRAFARSERTLGLGQVDLYLIHWPVSDRRLESWRALEHLYHEGRCRSIGVSNFTVRHLEELLAAAEVVPHVNQVEFSPFLYQRELLEFCRDHRIQLEGYAPLTRGERLVHPTLVRIANSHGATSAQVMLRWGLQHEVVEIPKSVRAERMRENARAFDLQLSPEEMRALDALDEGYRSSWDPSSMP